MYVYSAFQLKKRNICNNLYSTDQSKIDNRLYRKEEHKKDSVTNLGNKEIEIEIKLRSGNLYKHKTTLYSY